MAGKAITGATILVEAKFMHDAIKAIRQGNPCDKAKTLWKIQEELPSLPATEDLDHECDNYLEAMQRRGCQFTEEEATSLLVEISQAQSECERQDKERGVLVVGGEDGTSSQSLVASHPRRNKFAQALALLPKKNQGVTAKRTRGPRPNHQSRDEGSTVTFESVSFGEVSRHPTGPIQTTE